jgi:YNFM family putative membrane transporter
MLMAGLATFSLLYSVQPLLPAFADQFHLSAEASSLAVSLATGPMAVAILAAGILSDRIGRRELMIGSLFAAGLLSLATAFVPGWTALLVMRLLTGIALAGTPAVAMAFIAEEVEGRSVGAAMGLYVAGTAIGGMAGRLVSGVLADLAGWRVALGAVGAAGLVAAILFLLWVPSARAFVPAERRPGAFLAGLRRLMRDEGLPWLYAEAFLLMGAFVTIYNYAGFRLVAPPYNLGQGAVSAIFLLYLMGSFSSSWFGRQSGRIGPRHTLWRPIVLLLAGCLVTAATPLPLVILGIAMLTIGFFGAHAIASSWVGRRARADRGQATALYLFFYYLGSSLLGSAGGIAWTRAGWAGVAAFVSVLALLALLAGWRLAGVHPLPENVDAESNPIAPG